MNKITEYLDQNIKDLNLSRGQEQMFCLIRAILKNCSIYIIDEATSSLDQEYAIFVGFKLKKNCLNKIKFHFRSDNKIQIMLRRFLREKTVLTIAHRLDTIKDYNKIMVFQNFILVYILKFY